MNSDVLKGKGSSFLVSNGALVFFALCIAVALRKDAPLPAGLCLFFLLLAVVCRLWSSRSIECVSIGMHCPRSRLFPGQETTIRYEVENGKLLPLVWLELSQNGPEKDCLLPDEEFEAYQAPYETTHNDPTPFLRQSFSFIGGFQTLTVDSRWTAQRRGLYVINRLVARSGDGFGLAQQEQPLPAKELPVLAVYPQLIDVDLSLFLQPQWDTDTGSRGWMEDNTVLRGNREYSPGDNWKHINWRMTAREQGVPVNLYETIQPRGMHFILDGESYCEQDEALEQVLEVLSSVLIGLSGTGIQCSLSLSRSKRFPAITLHGDSYGSIDDLLLHLAGFDCLADRQEESDPITHRPVYAPSAFPTDAVPRTGSIFLITFSGDKLHKDLLRRLDPGKTTVFCTEAAETAEQAGLKALPLSSLQKGGDSV